MFKVDREKLSYHLAISFAALVAKSKIDNGELPSVEIASDMLFDFRTAYRHFLGEPNEIFDMKECINSEAPID